jgi:hypothetical protein
MVSALLLANLTEIICCGTFLGGFSFYSYFKLKGKTNKHRLVYYNLSDRAVKSKKLHQLVNDRAGGASKGDTFFKATK